LDDERCWYRYHGLLADVLHEQLNRDHTIDVADLHRRACTWLEQSGYTHQAFRHALAAGDIGLGTQIIRDRIFPLLMRASPSSVSAYLDRVSEVAIQSSPWLKVLRAWAKAYTGQYHEADRQLVTIGRELEEPQEHLSEQERLHLVGYASTVRAHTVEALGHHELAAQLARRALECLPADNPTMRSLATTMSAAADAAGGQSERAKSRLQEAAGIGVRGRDVNAAMVALCNVARVQMMMARLHDVAQTCETALAHAEAHERDTRERVPLTGYASSIYSAVLREWGELDEALQYAQRGHALSREWTEGQVTCRGYIALAQVQRERGELETAGYYQGRREVRRREPAF